MDFVDEVNPNRPRQRVIDWPLGGGRKVVVRQLGDDEREAAYFAARDHFDALDAPSTGGDKKKAKRKVDIKDPAFENRERVELVWRAFRATDAAGVDTAKPIAASAAALAKHPGELIDALYQAWGEYQREAAAKPVDDATVKQLVDALKKNTPAAALAVLPSSWLIAVITTLVDRPPNSPTANGSG